MNLSSLCDYLHDKSHFFIGIDGRSGAGKTSIAALISAGLAERERYDVVTIEVEDFIEGWTGLVSGIGNFARNVVRPLREDGAVHARHWNWYSHSWSNPVRIPDTGNAGIVLVTGCGSTSSAVVPYLDFTIWVEAPETIRQYRISERDSYDWTEHWQTWADQETQLLNERPSDKLADARFETA